MMEERESAERQERLRQQAQRLLDDAERRRFVDPAMQQLAQKHHEGDAEAIELVEQIFRDGDIES